MLEKGRLKVRRSKKQMTRTIRVTPVIQSDMRQAQLMHHISTFTEKAPK